MSAQNFGDRSEKVFISYDKREFGIAEKVRNTFEKSIIEK
jgi:hypothetical protein